jgi:hypothetical protein
LYLFIMARAADFAPDRRTRRSDRGGVATLTLSLSQRERAMSTLPLWGRDRERDCYAAQASDEDGGEMA